MEQYYIVQSQSQPKGTYQPTNIWTSAPVVWTILTTALVSGLFGALINHLLTKSRDKAKAKEELWIDLTAKTMTINISESLKDLNENIKKIGEDVVEVKTELAKRPTREEIQDGFDKVNKRIDNLVKGTPDEGKI